MIAYPFVPAADPLDKIKVGAEAACNLISFCAAPKNAVKTAVDTKETVTKVADFTSDPLGYIATSIQKACEDMTRSIFGALAKVLHPDFTVDWFLSAYRVSFALAVILMGFLVMTELARYRKGERGADEMLTTIIGSIPKFFLGVIMGPWIGNVVGACVGALCDGLIKWGGGNEGGIASLGGSLAGLISGTSATSVVGGAIVGIIVFGVMIISLIGVAVSMLFMMLALYLSGASFPIGWAWVTSSRNKDTAFKIVNLIVGLMLSPPLMLFMLGVVMSLVKSNLMAAGGDKGDTVTHLLSIVLAIMALLMAAVAPAALTKFAPVGVRASDGPGMPGMGSRGGGSKSSSSDGQLSQVSRANASKATSGGGAGGSGGGLGGGALGGGASSGGAAGGGAAGGGAAGAGAAAGPAAAVVGAVEAGKKIGQATDAGTDAAMDSAADTTGSSGGADASAASNSGGAGASSSQTSQASGKPSANTSGSSSNAAGGQGSATSRAGGSPGGAQSSPAGGGQTSRANGSQSSPFAGAVSSSGGGQSATGSSRGSGSNGSSPGGGGSSSKGSGGSSSSSGQVGSALNKAGSALGRVQQVGQRVNENATKNTHHQHGGHK